MPKNYTTKDFCRYLFSKPPGDAFSMRLTNNIDNTREQFLLLSFIFIQGIKNLTGRTDVINMSFDPSEFTIIRKYFRSIGFTCSIDYLDGICLYKIESEPTSLQNYGLYFETADETYIVKFDIYRIINNSSCA